MSKPIEFGGICIQLCFCVWCSLFVECVFANIVHSPIVYNNPPRFLRAQFFSFHRLRKHTLYCIMFPQLREHHLREIENYIYLWNPFIPQSVFILVCYTKHIRISILSTQYTYWWYWFGHVLYWMYPLARIPMWRRNLCTLCPKKNGNFGMCVTPQNRRCSSSCKSAHFSVIF